MTNQTEFRAAVLDPSAPVPGSLQDGKGAPAGRRFSVYRNNVAVSLTEALRTAFPVLQKLIGTQNFDRLAGLFLRAHPPRNPLMMHYGADLPAFLEAFAPLAHIGYLPDVARLENAMRRSYHAADMPPADPGILANLSESDLPNVRFEIAPSLELVPSDWPLHDIWRFNSQDDAPKPRAEPQGVVITRALFDPEPHALTPADTACLTAIIDGAPLGDAIESAATRDPGYDLGPLLGLLLAQNAITAITTTTQRT